MRLAVSTIGLPAHSHVGLLPALAQMGYEGIEVAPSRIWRDTWKGLTATQVAAYGTAITDAGLSVVGLHSLFFDQPDLGLFKGPEAFHRTVSFTRHLSAVCRDLGGRTLIYGGGRRRGGMSMVAAMDETEAFLAEVLPTMAEHGTILCFEPLGPKDTDFLNRAAECLTLVQRHGHRALGLQLDAKALLENNEMDPDFFETVRGHVVHFHANEPGLGVIGQGVVDHQSLAERLKSIGYDGWVSVEQRMVSEVDAMDDLRASLDAVRHAYGEFER